MTWFKGGSTPGVLTWNFLVKAADGTVLVTNVLLSGSHYLDGSTFSPQVDAIVRGAMRLADPQVGSTG